MRPHFSFWPRLRTLSLCIAAICTTPLVSSADGETGDVDLAIVGTDLLRESLQEPLEAFAASESFALKLELIGSYPALTQMRKGDADLAIVAFPDESERSDTGFTYIPFAFQVAFVLVHAENPLTEVNLPQLSGVFGINSETTYVRWNDLGLTGVWSNRSIKPVALSSQSSVVFELFKHNTLKSAPLRPSVSLGSTESEVVEVLQGDVGSLTVLERIPEEVEVKSLSVATGKPGDFAFGPTPENVFYGDYPLRMAVYLMFRPEDADELRPILRYMLSEDVSEIVTSAGFMALPENVRKRSLLELDIKQN